jgi:HlyD family secretion protein
VRIDRWGGPGELAGRVRRVEPAAVTKVSALGVEEQRVKVLIDLTSPPQHWAALGDGYRVGVRIVTRSEPQVLQVPVSAVFPAPAAEPATPATPPAASGNVGATAAGSAVFLVEQQRARLQPVRVLARNTRQAWLAGGLQAGQTVVIYPGAALRDGARVHPR